MRCVFEITIVNRSSNNRVLLPKIRSQTSRWRAETHSEITNYFSPPISKIWRYRLFFFVFLFTMSLQNLKFEVTNDFAVKPLDSVKWCWLCFFFFSRSSKTSCLRLNSTWLFHNKPVSLSPLPCPLPLLFLFIPMTLVLSLWSSISVSISRCLCAPLFFTNLCARVEHHHT